MKTKPNQPASIHGFAALLLSALLFFIVFQANLVAQTWSEDVATLVYNNCSSCHHEGSIAPFQLMGYQDAVDNADEIHEHVGDGHMPPWPADPEYRHFKDEAALSDEEIGTILTWIENGMPLGDPDLAPEPPVFPDNGSQLETIDFVAQIPPYTLQFDTDEYRWFAIETDFPDTVYVNKIEVIPGLPALVHHADISYDDTGYTQFLDALDPLPGFNSSTGSPNYTYYMNAWMAGGNLIEYPTGWGIAIPPGADLIFEIHYGPGGQGLVDETKMNLQFVTQEEVVRPIYAAWWLNQPTGEALIIPANTVQTFSQEAYVSQDYSFISICPHMHHVGVSYKVWFETAQGDSVPLINIPQWQFHWQKYYTFQQVQKIPAGSTLKGLAVYDNTVNNEDNPNDPPELVEYCSSTSCEMMMTFFIYSPYQSGDENTILDSTLLSVPSPSFEPTLSLYPNPAEEKITVEAFLDQPSPVDLIVTNPMGRVVMTQHWEISEKALMKTISIASLAPGPYFFQLCTPRGNVVQQFIKK